MPHFVHHMSPPTVWQMQHSALAFTPFAAKDYRPVAGVGFLSFTEDLPELFGRAMCWEAPVL